MNSLAPKSGSHPVCDVTNNFFLYADRDLADPFEKFSSRVLNGLRCLCSSDEFNQRQQMRRVKWMCDKNSLWMAASYLQIGRF